jgi:N-methylhydantoinase A
VLGRLDPTLGGKFTLDTLAAKRVVTRVAAQIGLSVFEAAEAIISITCENMAQAIKMVLTDRGRDPRDFTLASFGGAGAMHACFIARSMNIPKIIVPTYAGVASAYGAIAMDIRHDLESFYYSSVDAIDFDHLNRLYDGLEVQGRELLARDGVTAENMAFGRHAQMRYIGQFWEVLTPIMHGRLGPESVTDLKEAFHKAHETEHGVCTRSFPMEFVSIGLSATGRSKVPLRVSGRKRYDATAQIGTRRVYFSGRWFDVPVLRGDRLCPETKVEGPAIIDYPHFGTVLPPDTTAATDCMDNLIIGVA